MNSAQDFDDEVPQGMPMAQTVASPAAIAPRAPSRFQQFYVLTKPRVVQLIVFCAPDWHGAGCTSVCLPQPRPFYGLGRLRRHLAGGGAAAAFNCLAGTANRRTHEAHRLGAPPRGELTPTHPNPVVQHGLCAAGMLILAVWVRTC